MEFNEVIKRRASIRNYSPKKPRTEDIIKCLDYANLAPSPGNLSLLRYIIIENQEKIDKIAECCQQKFIKQAKIIVVICSDSKRAINLYDERAEKYIKHNAGAAIENFLLKITEMGLASCWVGAFVDSMVKNELRIPEEIEIEAIFPIGYQAKTNKTKQKTKLSINEKLFFETWKNRYRMPLEKVRREDI